MMNGLKACNSLWNNKMSITVTGTLKMNTMACSSYRAQMLTDSFSLQHTLSVFQLKGV